MNDLEGYYPIKFTESYELQNAIQKYVNTSGLLPNKLLFGNNEYHIVKKSGNSYFITQVNELTSCGFNYGYIAKRVNLRKRIFNELKRLYV